MTLVDVSERRAVAAPARRAGVWLAALGDAAPVALRGAAGTRVTIATGDDGRALSVVGDADEALPSGGASGPVAVVFDGVLYNRAELASALGDAMGAPADDAELLARAFRRWGEGALGKLKGAFALVVWDRSRDLVLCVRDRMGVYPLFYADTGRELLVSTAVAALTRHPRVPGTLNREAIADRLCNRWYEPAETYYEAVRRLPPGHAMRITGAGRQVVRYWHPVPEGGDVEWVRESDALDLFDAALDQAVERCFGFGRIGIFLSGGLDSVSISALAVEKSNARGLPVPQALSLIFPDEANEEDRQRGVAAALGVPHLLVPWEQVIGNVGHVESALAITRASAMPLLNFWVPGYTRLAQEGAARDCRVVLNGTGGDEWLGVSPYLAADLIGRFDIAGLYRLWNSKRLSYTNPPLLVLHRLLWKFGLRPLLAGYGARALRSAAPWILRRRKRQYILSTTPAWVAPDASLRQRIDRRAEELIPDPELGPFYLREMQTALGHQIVSMEAEENFELGRRAGVRIAAPYWDADLIDLLYRVPPEVLNRGGRTKGLVRDAVARRYPKLGFSKQKKVISVNYFASTVYDEWPRAWERLGGVSTLAELGVIDPVRFKAAADDLVARRPLGSGPFQIWDVLNLESWAREHY